MSADRLPWLRVLGMFVILGAMFGVPALTLLADERRKRRTEGELAD